MRMQKEEQIMEDYWKNGLYLRCQFCDSDLGKATEIKGLILKCQCGERLLVNSDRYGVKVERAKKAS